MSLTPPVLPPGLDRLAWEALDMAAQQKWVDFCRDIGWLMDQPQFRRAIFSVLDDPRFCGAFRSTFDPDPARHSYLSGRRDVGVELQVHLQAIAPKMWMRTLHEQMNQRRPAPPEENT